MKQSAVEWVFQELDNYYQMKSKFKSKKEILKQAKEMENQQGYSKEEVLKAGEIGEINHYDYKHIVSLLDEAKQILKNK